MDLKAKTICIQPVKKLLIYPAAKKVLYFVSQYYTLQKITQAKRCEVLLGGIILFSFWSSAIGSAGM